MRLGQRIKALPGGCILILFVLASPFLMLAITLALIGYLLARDKQGYLDWIDAKTGEKRRE